MTTKQGEPIVLTVTQASERGRPTINLTVTPAYAPPEVDEAFEFNVEGGTCSCHCGSTPGHGTGGCCACSSSGGDGAQ